MDAADLLASFRGTILDGVYGDGTSFTETYFEDGSIRYRDATRSDSGEWSVRGDTFCTFYTDQSGACFVVERDADHCFSFFEATKESSGKVSVGSTAVSQGWNRLRPGTCKAAASAGARVGPGFTRSAAAGALTSESLTA